MGGASPDHVLITTNVASEFRSQFKNRLYRVYAADLRVRVRPTGLYTYLISSSYVALPSSRLTTRTR